MSKITVLKVDKQKIGKATATVVSYTSEDGKTKGMKIFPFDDQKEVADAFVGAKQGDVFEVNFRKNDRDFWEFSPTPVKVGANAVVPTAKEKWVPDSDRQRMIVRQNSVTNATAFVLGTKGAKSTPEEVIKVAQVFEAYVMEQPAVQSSGDVE